MQLIPKRPPGRVDRKASRYAGEIQRLRSEGYSLEAIRLALLDVGVAVSLSTVKREAARKHSNQVRRPPNDADVTSAVQEVDSDGSPTSEPEDLAQLIERLFEPPDGTVRSSECIDENARERNPQRSYPSWLMRLLQGVRRPS